MEEVVQSDSSIRDRWPEVVFQGFVMQTVKSSPPPSRPTAVVSASKDSHVYVWKHEVDTRTYRTKGLTVSRSFEHLSAEESAPDANEVSTAYHPRTPVEESNDSRDWSGSASCCSNSPLSGTISSTTSNYLFDRIASSWTDEKLVPVVGNRNSPGLGLDFTIGMTESMLAMAWGLVIVTAGLRGEIRIFQNFGLPIRI